MPQTYQDMDYYKDTHVSDKRIGENFSGCYFNWKFPAQLLVLKNDSTVYDIEYSFDGTHVAGRLRKGTNPTVGGQSFTYETTNIMKVYFRIAAHEWPGVGYNEDDAPYSVTVYRAGGGGR